MNVRRVCVLALVAAMVTVASAADANGKIRGWLNTYKAGDAFYSSSTALTAVANLLKWECPGGGWPTDTDTTAAGGKNQCSHAGSFDDSATTAEVRFLSRYVAKNPSATAARDALSRAIALIISAQYANGGWPQWKGATGYHDQVTFNDGVQVLMTGIMSDVATNAGGLFGFVSAAVKAQAKAAYDKAIQVILRCQITSPLNKQKAGWGGQYDKTTLQPGYARAFEPVAYATSETVAVVNLLMTIKNPSAAIQAAVKGAVAWLQATGDKSITVVKQKIAACGSSSVYVVTKKADSNPWWSRFLTIANNVPTYCDRADPYPPFKCFTDIAKVGCERRSGYAWFGQWPLATFKTYNSWLAALPKAAAAPVALMEAEAAVETEPIDSSLPTDELLPAEMPAPDLAE